MMMEAPPTYHVQKHQQSGGWSVRRSSSMRPERVFTDKKAAITYAEQRGSECRMVVHVHNERGDLERAIPC